jgi:hypothetical protein
METYTVWVSLFLWCAVPLAAIGSLAWAILARGDRKRGASTVALCLVCVLVGGTLSGSLWSWMTTTNLEYLSGRIASLPPGGQPIQLEPQSMGMLKFFVRLDRLLGRFLYATTLVPLVIAVVLYRRSSRSTILKDKSPTPDDEFTEASW